MLARKLTTMLAAVAGTLLLVSNFSSDKVRSRQLKEVKSTHSIIEPDGTLLTGRRADVPPCDFFTPNGAGVLVTPERPITSLHYHFVDCAEHQLGNRLGEHYLQYLVANAARIPYKMTCGNHESNSTKQALDPTSGNNVVAESVLRHVSVSLQEPGPVPIDPWSGKSMTPTNVCPLCRVGGWWCDVGPNSVVDIMQADMKKIAYETEIGASFEPEDVVIHLRLGDALKGKKDEGIGILPNSAYAMLIEEAEKEKGPVRTIGLVTQPFKRKLVRSFDKNAETLAKSRLVAFELKKYLERKFHAVVTIHNDEKEIPIKSYARLIRAQKAAICGSSTFCTYPVLATEGTGYIFRAHKHSPWASHVAQFQTNIRTYKTPILANNMTDTLDDIALLHWLQNQLPYGECTISDYPLIRNEPIADPRKRL